MADRKLTSHSWWQRRKCLFRVATSPMIKNVLRMGADARTAALTKRALEAGGEYRWVSVAGLPLAVGRRCEVNRFGCDAEAAT
jgi:hypothetical protein